MLAFQLLKTVHRKRSGDMDEGLRGLVALAEEQNWVPRTHVKQLTTAHNSSSRESNTHFWPPWGTPTLETWISIHMNSYYICISKKQSRVSAGEMVWWPGFYSQHPHDNLQPSLNSIPRGSNAPFWTLGVLHECCNYYFKDSLKTWYLGSCREVGSLTINLHLYLCSLKWNPQTHP